MAPGQSWQRQDGFFTCTPDACYEDGSEGLGGVLYDGFGNLMSFFLTRVESDQVALLNPNGKKTIIFELEALAVFVACLTLLPTEGIFQNHRVVTFVDNEAVLARLVSGRGGGEIGNLIFSGVMSWECEANVLAWYERVPGSANIADAPSRGDVSGLDSSLAINVRVSDVLQSLLEVCPSDVKGGGTEGRIPQCEKVADVLHCHLIN